MFPKSNLFAYFWKRSLSNSYILFDTSCFIFMYLLSPIYVLRIKSYYCNSYYYAKNSLLVTKNYLTNFIIFYFFSFWSSLHWRITILFITKILIQCHPIIVRLIKVLSCSKWQLQFLSLLILTGHSSLLKTRTFRRLRSWLLSFLTHSSIFLFFNKYIYESIHIQTLQIPLFSSHEHQSHLHQYLVKTIHSQIYRICWVYPSNLCSHLIFTRAPRLSYLEHYCPAYTPLKVKYSAPLCLGLAGTVLIGEVWKLNLWIVHLDLEYERKC